MAIADQLRDLSSRIQEELARGSNYYAHTQVVWRMARTLVTEDESISIENIDTGDKTDGPALASLVQGYVDGYLAESVFQTYVSLLEDYIFGLIGIVLIAHPKGIVGLDEDERDDRLKKADRNVPLAVIIDNPDRESILQAVVDRELDRLKYRRLAAWFDYLEKRANLGIPDKDQIDRLAEIKASRDLLVHNRGVANQTYLAKSAGKARYAEGSRIKITDPYLRNSWLLISEVVRTTSEAAIAKFEAPVADQAADL